MGKIWQYLYSLYIRYLVFTTERRISDLETRLERDSEWAPTPTVAILLLETLPLPLIKTDFSTGGLSKTTVSSSFVSAYDMVKMLKTFNHFINVRSVHKAERYLPDSVKNAGLQTHDMSLRSFLKSSDRHPMEPFELKEQLVKELQAAKRGLNKLLEEGESGYHAYYSRYLATIMPGVFSVIEAIIDTSLYHHA